MDYARQFSEYQQLINQALNSFLPGDDVGPTLIHQAMRYCVMNRGKRLRPIFAVIACELCGGTRDEALGLACGIELIHTYSLIHDDLPSMDNDDYRRGKPSCHKQYGEAVAILTGDALLSLSYKLMCESLQRRRKVEIIRNVCDAIGSFGMVGGQVLDLRLQESDAAAVDEKTLLDIIHNKTARLFSISLESGAMLATDDEEAIRRLSEFGTFFGLVFQLVDDIMDNEAYIATIGKGRLRELVTAYSTQARERLSGFGPRAALLEWFLEQITQKAAAPQVYS
ncbi:MAG: polyprenyl synthetase family protein [Candidatus Omnitrophica bacterium]|nr:polyprenyl synthetase family protein [Candidatus Omnitrophota bacterium]